LVADLIFGLGMLDAAADADTISAAARLIETRIVAENLIRICRVWKD
jgi:hypothetical protein